MTESALERLRTEFKAQFPNEPTVGYQSLSDRVRRSLSWMKKALDSPRGSSIRFVEMWIALNALYGQRHYASRSQDRKEAEDFAEFVDRLLNIDGRRELSTAIRRVSHDITRLVSNPYLWNEYWREERRYQDLSREAARIARLGSRESLQAVFPRLLVLRNQIVHGSAAEDTKGNRGSAVPATRVLEELVPCFAGVMIRHGRHETWPPVPYPRAGTPLHPQPRR